MIPRVFDALLRVHLACALGATLLFWVAALARKGGVRHRAAGRWFARLIYATAITGAIMAAANLAAAGIVHPPDPSRPPPSAADADVNRQTMWLVLYVLLIIVAPVQHGVAVALAGPMPVRVRSRWHAALALLSIVGSFAILPAALLWGQWLFLIVAPIGAIVGIRQLSYASRRTARPEEWRREHLTSLITAGITLHTAFFVFGTSRSLEWTMAGPSQVLPWVLPALVGLPVILWWRGQVATRIRSTG